MRKMRVLFAVAILIALPLGLIQAAQAQTELYSNPRAIDGGHLIVRGVKVALWGINALAADQTCWRNEERWDCGAAATKVLRGFAEQKQVRCRLSGKRSDGDQTAQCVLQDGDQPRDLSLFMVGEGYALDRTEESGNAHAQAQEIARQGRRGIWTSRFQTPQDWRAGVQKFVVYDMAPSPPKPVVPVIEQNTTIIQENNYFVPDGSGPIIIHHPHRPHPVKPPVPPIQPLPPQGEHEDPEFVGKNELQKRNLNNIPSTDEDIKRREQIEGE